MAIRILLLNPPSPDGRFYNRHVMDPHVSKGDYLYPPYDLLLLSGHFHPSDAFDLSIIDAVAAGYTEEHTLDLVRRTRPQVIVALTAPQAHREDLAFLRRAKETSGARLFTMGAVQHARKRVFLDQHPWMDGIVREPLGEGLRRHLMGEAGPFDNLLLPSDPPGWLGEMVMHRPISYPLPRHDLLPLDRYRYPAMRSRKFTSVLASYGCPYQCTYCEAPAFGFKTRAPAEVLEELRFVRSLGVTEVCFKDWTFGANRKLTAQLLDGMIEANLGIRWFTFSRTDVLDQALIRQMKAAGCHTLQIGVESAQTDILVEFKRKVDRARLEEVFRTCRREGIATLATLVLGLPGDDEAGVRSTIDYVIDLDPDYASFNIITPLIGSRLRDEWEAAGYIDPEQFELQDSTRAGLTHLPIEPRRLEALRDLAVRRFYFRPRYIARRLRDLRSWGHFRNQAAVGWSLFRTHVLHLRRS